ncbi:MAG: hypothetical protein HQL46_10845 [Gammaproteobacteria bacterium]|nr:hypothetical protein [Gammaproteobacteria bacterium]
MHKEQLIFVRNETIKLQQRTLPADYYNQIHLLFAQAKDSQVFIPIRSMQFLAVIDKTEVMFVHSVRKQFVCVSWNHFKPQERETLTDVVSYQCEIYEQEYLDVMLRLHGEFLNAIQLFKEKQPNPKPSKVTSLYK